MATSRAPLLDLRLLGRHQIAAGLATAVDFGTMVALVELLQLPPALATVLSATCGGIVNFTVERLWAFRRRHGGSARSQAGRYAAVSFGGAMLNAVLLQGILFLSSVPYVLARGFVSIAVSLAYAYPMHMRVVFRVASDPRRRERPIDPTPPTMIEDSP
ncbi:MAG: GtrA family protein [Polyangiaceae bacterium]|nr:GtrA family protein [Polyangiaceae bacterium]